MKAKIKSRDEISTNRERLENKIPLNTPFLILIEPSDKCNFRCKFCPTSDLKLMQATVGRNYGNMDFNLYKKVIDDIVEFDNNIKMIYLYKDGEPLLNPYFPDMVKYARDSKCIDKISTTTNASLLNQELSLRIIEAGLDKIQISIEGINAQQYLNISNVKIDFNKLVDNIEFFYNNKKQCEVYIKIVGNNLNEEDKTKFYDIFGNICDFIFIENATPIWNNFEIVSNINITIDKTLYGKEVKYKNVCPQIFYSMAVNSNGTVSPCCNDWSRKLIIGDANYEKIKDIWNGEKLIGLQKLHLEGGRKNHSTCSSCGMPEFSSIDNIDDYAEEILFKLIGQDRTGQDRTGQDTCNI